MLAANTLDDEMNTSRGTRALGALAVTLTLGEKSVPVEWQPDRQRKREKRHGR